MGGSTIYLKASHTAYQSESNGGSDPAETRYEYTFAEGQLQPLSKTTILPPVAPEHNGSGVSQSRTEVYDAYGRATWSRDERGFITYTPYDPSTGALIQRIQDVETSMAAGAPSGWSTPPGGGLHLVTDYQFDAQGRNTRKLGPVHTVDLK